METITITREFIASRIDDLLAGKVTRVKFGKEMFWYLAEELPDSYKYEYEKGYENIIKSILSQFSDMHDLDQGNVGYQPHCPSKEEFEYFRACLRDQKEYKESASR